MRLHVGKEPGAVGYAAIGDTALAYTRGQVAPPDLNELFQVAKVDAAGDPYFQSEAARGLVPKNRWPERPAALKELYIRYYLRMGQLAGDLMRLSALALDLPENLLWRQDRPPHQPAQRSPLSRAKGSALCPANCAPRRTPTTARSRSCNPGDTVGGLQVADRNGNWHDVPSIPNSFVINQGDLMARWTNDRWLSTLHRVANPPEEAKGGSRRLSIVFFHHPEL